MKRVADVSFDELSCLLRAFGLSLQLEADNAPIRGSFWGEPEAGIVGHSVFVRADTPLHSLLHETAHIVCMTGDRRAALDRDAGGDDLEEAAVCYLQVVLADRIEGVGRDCLMQDMDAWGYSFRLGSTQNWFQDDAEDAKQFLLNHGLLDAAGEATLRLRK